MLHSAFHIKNLRTLLILTAAAAVAAGRERFKGLRDDSFTAICRAVRTLLEYGTDTEWR